MTNIKVGDLCRLFGYDSEHIYLVIDIMPAGTKIYKDANNFNIFADSSKYMQYDYDCCVVTYLDNSGKPRFAWRTIYELTLIT